MRVLMTADTLGGVWTYAMALARGLSERGVEVHLATMGRMPSRDQLAQACAIAGLTLHPSQFKLCWMPRPWDDLGRAADWLRQLARRLQPDLVHLNDFGHGAMHWPAPVLLVGHSCVLSWWQAVHGVEPPPEWRRYRQLVRDGLQRADRVVAPSHAMATALQRHYGLREAREVIPNGLPLPTQPPAVEREAVILGAGRLWDEAKNLGVLAEVAAALPWKIVVAGEGGETPPIDNLVLTGLLDTEQLQDWYRRAAIFVLPARYEPFGLVALEAALRGCALVLGDIPSLREIWDDAARYVPPDDPQRLVSVLRELIERPAQRRHLAALAAARAARYTDARMTSCYLEIYRQLVDRRLAARQPSSHLRGSRERSSYRWPDHQPAEHRIAGPAWPAHDLETEQP